MGAWVLSGSSYVGKDYIFSQAERSFYEVLKKSIGFEFTVFAKVRLIDLVYLRKGTEKRQSWKNRIQSKHVDFVLCEPKNLKPVIVVELDGASLDKPDWEVRDGFVDRVLETAGIRIVRVRARETYSVNQIAEMVHGTNIAPK